MLRWTLNVGSGYLRFVVAAAVVMAMTPWIIGQIGVDAYGKWAVALAITGLLGLADFGLATAAVRFIAERTGAGDMKGRNRVLSTLFTLYCILGAVVVAATVLWVVVRPAGDATDATGAVFTACISLTVALGFQLSLFRAALAGTGRMYLANLVEIASQIVYAALTLSFLSGGAGLIGLGASLALSSALGTLAMVITCCASIEGLRLRLHLGSRRDLAPLVSFSGWAFLANAAVLVILRADALVLEGLVPLSAVAAYAVAARIGEYSLLLNKQFSNALMPLVSQAHGAGETDTVRGVLVDGTRYLLVIALPLTGLIAWYATPLFRLWLGEGFASSGTILQILSAAVFVSALQLNAANVLGMTGRHRTVALAMLGSAASKVALTLMLVSMIGPVGAALATLVASAAFELGIIVPLACRHVGIRLADFLRQAVWPIVPATLPGLAAAVWLRHVCEVNSLLMLLGQASLCATAFLVAFCVTSLRPAEREALRALLRREVKGPLAAEGGSA